MATQSGGQVKQPSLFESDDTEDADELTYVDFLDFSVMETTEGDGEEEGERRRAEAVEAAKRVAKKARR